MCKEKWAIYKYKRLFAGIKKEWKDLISETIEKINILEENQ